MANDLIALIPELGQMTGRRIASLIGLAPKANGRGKRQGYARTGYGRQGIKSQLFLAAMAARNSHSRLDKFYERLTERGNPKMVALTVLSQKIIGISNARVRDL